MRIANRTRWNTEDLRFIVGQCLQMLSYKSKDLSVTFKTSKRPGWRAFSGRTFSDGESKPDQLPRYRFLVRVSDPSPTPFDPAHEWHTHRVVELTRNICDALIWSHGG